MESRTPGFVMILRPNERCTLIRDFRLSYQKPRPKRRRGSFSEKITSRRVATGLGFPILSLSGKSPLTAHRRNDPWQSPQPAFWRPVMKRQCIRFGLAAFVVAAITILGAGTAQAAPWSHGHHGHHGWHGHHGHHGHHGWHGHHGRHGRHGWHGHRRPPVVVVRPPRPRPPVYVYPRPRYRPGCISPGAEIAGGVLRITNGASRW